MRALIRHFVLPLLLAPAALAQQAKPLSLETLLQGGPALAISLPQLVWQPQGHGASLLSRNDDGSQNLLPLDDSLQGVGAGIAAADILRALGLGGKGPARIPPCTFGADDSLRFDLGNRIVRLELATMTSVTALQWPEGATAQLVAPGDGRAAFVKDDELWLAEQDGTIKQLTHDGSADIVYGGAAHRAEFGITTGLFWSANGRYLAFSREDMRPITPYPYQDLDAEQPAPLHGRYPMAGRVHSKVTIGVCDTADFAIHWLEHDPDEDVYWTNIAVQDDGAVVTARVNRAQDDMELVRYDGATGARQAVLVHEHDREWIEPEHPPTFLPDGRFLWWSRRCGFRHLWLCAADGTVLHEVTKGPFDVQSLLAADADTVWFQAAGTDPRQLHLFRAAVATGETEQLTQQRGTHRAELSADRRRAYVAHSSLDTPPHAYVLDLDSGDSHELPAAHNPLLDYALPRQQFFTVEANDGSTLYGHVAIPSDLEPGQRRPVLLYVYGGPHAQLVTDTWLGGAATWLQALAAEGYVLCRLDNHGTPNRGIDFEQAIFRRLGTLEVEDQLLAVEWLRQQPFADTDRIGVHGWSFGGYMTLRLLLLAPETFACGISGAPVTDWSMYETGYTERYMDTPAENGDGYAGSSCLPLAGKLRTPLLLVHGTDDKTVMWSHTLRFVDRCIDAGTTLTYFPYPMQQHGLRGKDRVHFMRMMRDFLRRHLGEPGGR